MKKIMLISCALTAFTAIFSSCEGTSTPRERNGRGGNATAAVIEKHIKQMEAEPWDKKVYLDIRHNQIDSFKGSTKAKESLYELLDFSYGIVLVREGNGVLDQCDKDKHGHLNKVMKELQGFPEAKDGKKLRERYESHQQMLRLIDSLSYKQKVNSVKDKYDVAFEKEKEKRAKAFLATAPTCKHITSKLSNTKSYFQDRRKDYAQKLVNLYCNQPTYEQSIELIVKGNINAACGYLTKEQNKKMDEFKEKKLKEAQEAQFN